MRLSTSVLVFSLVVSTVAVQFSGFAAAALQRGESDRTAEILISAESRCGLHDGRRCDDRS
ncbi:hypothetical protein NG796_01615 [Laspinema sp. A4]|uniref:hypothetical protein n=1 Tax=Laspinema sp. D2d TaxID=2953686 RepID=UPI0021BB5539|nr:hypothetical protein [Laspinema sp. D2d]MCT7981985.1 hypothetical protein [Laspinema sp. D2d]